MRILVLASGGIAVPPLRWLENADHEIVGVVTQPDRQGGRGRKPIATPVKTYAVEAGLPLIQTEMVNAPDQVEALLAAKPDLGVTVAFSQKIGAELLHRIPLGCLNIHPSLLPKCRGAAPVNWTIIRGQTRTGVSVFRLVERMDAGPVLAVRETMIKPSETAGELYDRLAGIGCDALDGALSQYDGGRPPEGTPQDDELATAAPRMTKQLGRISLRQRAAEVVRWANGLFPWPGVQLHFVKPGSEQRVQVRLARTAVAEDPQTLAARQGRSAPMRPPGTVLEGGIVACGDGAIRILEIQPAGGRIMLWQDFVNGRHVEPGDRFECVDMAGPS